MHLDEGVVLVSMVHSDVNTSVLMSHLKRTIAQSSHPSLDGCLDPRTALLTVGEGIITISLISKSDMPCNGSTILGILV